jgi:predicted transcriptional regulator
MAARTRDDVSRAVAGLGPLEARLMEIVWSRPAPVGVRDAQRDLPELAYTTVMTTLDRLYKKGVLARRKAGRAFVYSPRFTPDELRQTLARGVIARLLGAAGGSPRPVLSGLVDSVESDRLLDELETIVRDRRERLRREGR